MWLSGRRRQAGIPESGGVQRKKDGVRAGNGALQEWKTGSGRFLAPVKVFASLFRRRFLEELASLVQSG